MIPFLYVVHCALRGRTVTNENLPWKFIFARSRREAAEKFCKRNPQYWAIRVLKI